MIGPMLQSAFQVLLAGLAFGAGLPAVFALGIKLWSMGTPEPDADGVARRNPAALAAAGLCFLVVLAAVILGVLWITQKSLYHYLGISVF